MLQMEGCGCEGGGGGREARGARITTTTTAAAAAAIDHRPGRRVMSPAIRGRTDNTRHYPQFYHRGCCCLPLFKIR
ncbi:hypothetical protein E2C01_029002 [Portunus trituberculatus]|uniref:Uncharacterized protein n=1 Tax=Portunus trituberculatus TaxID=210409 RepID=A0A5B7EQP1_PORTR|nr:hypothetical protein [Portunus trituberculatus]